MSTDLKRRNIPFSPPDMTEAEAEEVKNAILSGWITTGPRTKKLEILIADYVGVNKFQEVSEGTMHPNCVCLNSQTACGEMALRVLGVGPGDEVIVPAYTYTASASIVSHVGATIKMVDVNANINANHYNLEMDYDKLAAAITEKTKAIIPVDLGGIPCDYDRIFAIVEEKKGLFHPANDIQKKLGRIAVCCDAAHAFGAWRNVNLNQPETSPSTGSGQAKATETLKLSETKAKRMVGAIADFSNFSFHAVKNFTTAEGGAMTWNLPFGEEVAYANVNDNLNDNYYPTVPKKEGETWNQLIYRLVQLFSLHGQNKDALAKTKLGAWEYDIIGPWYKCNMTDVVAAIGLIQFERYPELLAKRSRYIERMDEAFDSFNVSEVSGGCKIAHLNHYTSEYSGSGHLYLVRLLGKGREDANKVIELMAERGIACNVHYKPLPMMTAYKAMGFDIKNYPNAFHMFENVISLPLNTKMTDEDVEYVIENFIDIVKNL